MIITVTETAQDQSDPFAGDHFIREGEAGPSDESIWPVIGAGVSVAARDLFDSDINVGTFAKRAAGTLAITFVANAIGVEAKNRLQRGATRGNLLIATGGLSVLGGIGMTIRGAFLTFEGAFLAETGIGAGVVLAIGGASLAVGYEMIDQGIGQLQLGGADLGYW